MKKVKCACCGNVFETDEVRDICDICFYVITNYRGGDVDEDKA